jgi:hypothetical protein
MKVREGVNQNACLLAQVFEELFCFLHNRCFDAKLWYRQALPLLKILALLGTLRACASVYVMNQFRCRANGPQHSAPANRNQFCKDKMAS